MILAVLSIELQGYRRQGKGEGGVLGRNSAALWSEDTRNIAASLFPTRFYLRTYAGNAYLSLKVAHILTSNEGSLVLQSMIQLSKVANLELSTQSRYALRKPRIGHHGLYLGVHLLLGAMTVTRPKRPV